MISPFDRSILFYQRAEKLQITEIKTHYDYNNIKIKIENIDGVNNPLHSSHDSYKTLYPPIIISGLNLFSTSFGNIPVTHINNKVFYHVDDKLSSTTNYYQFDASDPTTIFYELFIFNDDTESKASFTTVTTLDTSILPHTENGQPLGAYVGRALETKVYSDSKTSTFGKFLGLATENKTNYIHTNIENNIVKNKVAWKVTGTEQLSLATNDYIFLRIKSNSNIITDNMRCAKGNISESKLIIENDNLFFAKIIFSDKPPGDISIISVGGNKIYYETPIISLDNLTIEFLDFTGKVIQLYQDHSFTLKIVELREILKDSLVESRKGTIFNTGIKENC